MINRKTIFKYFLHGLFVMGLAFVSVNLAQAARSKERFVKLDSLQSTGLGLFINQSALEHDLSQGEYDLKIHLDGTGLLRSQHYPQNIKLEIYTLVNGEKSLVSLLNRTVKSKKAARNVFFKMRLPRIEATTDLMFDVFDSEGVVHSTFTQEVTIDDAGIANTLEQVPEFTCADNDGECLLEYILRNITFSANYNRGLRTQVHKNDKGRFVVNIPIKRRNPLGKRVKKSTHLMVAVLLLVWALA